MFNMDVMGNDKNKELTPESRLKDFFEDITGPMSRSDYNIDTTAPQTVKTRIGETRRRRKKRKRMAKASQEIRNEGE